MIADWKFLDSVDEHDVVPHVGVVVEQRRHLHRSGDGLDSEKVEEEEQDACPEHSVLQ